MSPRRTPEREQYFRRVAEGQGQTISVEPPKRSGSRYGLASKGRGNSGKMSPAERAYSEHLTALGGEWWFEPVAFILAQGSRYEPDFMYMCPGGRIEFHDVKSGVKQMDAHGVTKMKVAADKFPFVFVKVVKRAKKDGGGWALTVFGGDCPGAQGERSEREEAKGRC